MKKPPRKHPLVATLIHERGGSQHYVLGFAGREIQVRIDGGGDMHLLTPRGWAELGSSLSIAGGPEEHLARAAGMALGVAIEFEVTVQATD